MDRFVVQEFHLNKKKKVTACSRKGKTGVLFPKPDFPSEMPRVRSLLTMGGKQGRDAIGSPRQREPGTVNKHETKGCFSLRGLYSIWVNGWC